ncbi:MAG: hypothetical protein WAV85_06140, partial [Rhodoferax sp.]
WALLISKDKGAWPGDEAAGKADMNRDQSLGRSTQKKRPEAVKCASHALWQRKSYLIALHEAFFSTFERQLGTS